MDRDETLAPRVWSEDLQLSDEDLAQGRVVPARVVHEMLREAAVELEAEIDAEARPPTKRFSLR